MNPTLLDVDDLSVSFGTRNAAVHAVNGVSWSLAPGEILGIVGESGSGKSVTAMAVMRLLRPRSTTIGGSVRLDGRDLLALPEGDMRRVRGREIAMIFQDPMTSLNPVLSIGRQIEEVLRVHENLTGRGARARAVELLKLVGVPAAAERVDQYPHQLSGGMRQRAVIAIALSCQPKLLIADEPTTALDVTVQAQILEVLGRLRRELGAAIVLITHDLGVVAGLCDRVAVMYAGRIVEQAPVDELFDAPQHPYTLGLLRCLPRPQLRRAERLVSVGGNPPNLAALPRGCAFAPRCSAAFEPCSSRPPLTRDGADHAVACWAHTGAELRS